MTIEYSDGAVYKGAIDKSLVESGPAVITWPIAADGVKTFCSMTLPARGDRVIEFPAADSSAFLRIGDAYYSRFTLTFAADVGCCDRRRRSPNFGMAPLLSSYSL